MDHQEFHGQISLRFYATFPLDVCSNCQLLDIKSFIKLNSGLQWNCNLTLMFLFDVFLSPYFLSSGLFYQFLFTLFFSAKTACENQTVCVCIR